MIVPVPLGAVNATVAVVVPVDVAVPIVGGFDMVVIWFDDDDDDDVPPALVAYTVNV